MKSPLPMNNEINNNNNNDLLFDILIVNNNGDYKYDCIQFIYWLNINNYDTDAVFEDIEDFIDDDGDDDSDDSNDSNNDNSNIYKYFCDLNKLFLFDKIKKIIKKYKS